MCMLIRLVFFPGLANPSRERLPLTGVQVRRSKSWPHVEGWFVAMESRPSYRNIQSDFYTHVHDLPPQVAPWRCHLRCTRYWARGSRLG